MAKLLSLSLLPDVQRIARMLRSSFESGEEGEECRYFGYQASDGVDVRCSIFSGLNEPLPTARHLSLLDAIVNEIQCTDHEHIPLERVMELTRSTGFDATVVERFCFRVDVEWQGYHHFSGVTSYRLCPEDRKVLPMPSDSILDPFDSILGSVRPGITFSKRMADLWRGAFEFRDRHLGRLRRMVRRDYTKRVKGQCYRESALQVIAALCDVDLMGFEAGDKAQDLILELLQESDALIKDYPGDRKRRFEGQLLRLKGLLRERSHG